MAANNVIAMKGVRELPKSAPKTLKSTTEALILTQDAVKAWKLPPFQRALRVNSKVTALAEEMRSSGGYLPGILTVGILDRVKYLVDGQHRVAAFEISNLPEVYAEIRLCHFETMADMAEEFVTLNSRLVNMLPDDILRGLEESHAGLKYIRKHCSFVGYGQVRRGTAAPIVSMSLVLRCWFRSAPETPVSGGNSVAELARMLTEEEAEKIVQFLNVVFGAWGRDSVYFRLWGGINLCVCMWLWRRTVLSQFSAKSARMNALQFGKCMMSLSADSGYVDWLVGRNINDRDRGPCYNRVKSICSTRLAQEVGHKQSFPQPAWAS